MLCLILFFIFFLAFARSFQVHLQTKKHAKTKQMALQIAFPVITTLEWPCQARWSQTSFRLFRQIFPAFFESVQQCILIEQTDWCASEYHHKMSTFELHFFSYIQMHQISRACFEHTTYTTILSNIHPIKHHRTNKRRAACALLLEVSSCEFLL